MSEDGLARAREKMTTAGVSGAAIEAFAHYYGELEQGATGLVPEAEIDPVTDLPVYEDIAVTPDQAREALGQTVFVKLNGGLGTSMGMSRAKSLLPVRDGLSFLDITVRQVLAARAEHDVRLPLLLMDSFNTQQDTLAALAAYPELPVDGLPLDFLQSQEPKLLASDLTPVSWPADPRLEWCPPGHGDIYPSLLGSGVLDLIVEQGYRYLAVSNGDNLGAAPDARIVGWFASTGAPYAAEVTPRTPMDRKGGHLAHRKSDGRLILRETAQTPPDEMRWFTDETRHPFAHCNNLWLDAVRLRDTLRASSGVLGLPLIRNLKTVDPRDPSSPEVVQVESAMGAAVGVFEGATALVVPRSRFLPVKGTAELLLVRSDVYDLRADGTLERTVDQAPVVELGRSYKRIGDFEARFPAGPPSLARAQRLDVAGDYTFGSDVVVVGDVTLPDDGAAHDVPDGSLLEGPR
ncbi:UTP--glucose-1-phosphate uridylyltransferase [Arsenicicoccus piscis]|nr:UTP--glucose-1-phosphate uridylyltransferase [Arsenicicoccus piscis]MCH8629368.1 UTP--glucose-1-phosphate uridylyltransferase [Arsenicicoccus piscis]